MLLSISTTHVPATDLGYLLHKNPSRVHALALTFGTANVVYTEATEERCTATVLVDVDPVKLVRGTGDGATGRYDQYVNDRPYASSSFLSTALVELFGTAMNGRSKDRQELADSAIELSAEIPVVSVHGGESFLRGVFEPLGYDLEVTAIPLDARFPEWGESSYFQVRLSATKRIRDFLTHLYVLIPVLDETKHYFVGRDEVDKLLKRGQDWLNMHPLRDAITQRYLRRDRTLTREALERLAEADGNLEPDETTEANDEVEAKVERPLSLHEQRIKTVAEAIGALGVQSVVDLGCGEGRLLRLLIADASIERIVGMDVSVYALERAKRFLRLDRMPERQAARLSFLHGSLVYRDRRLEGFDAAALVEVIEHLDPARLAALERNVFEFARPRNVIVTTPNREYNVLFPTLPEGKLRHPDHRFEWTREEFQNWSEGIAERFGYDVSTEPLGPVDEQHGAPSQMATFRRKN